MSADRTARDGGRVDDATLKKLVIMAMVEAGGLGGGVEIRLDEVHRLVRVEGERYLAILADPEKKRAWLAKHKAEASL